MYSTRYHRLDKSDLNKFALNSVDKLIISTMEGHHLIYQSNIKYLRSDSNYCQLYFVDGTSLLCSRTLKSVYALLNNKDFVRTHRCIVINTRLIRHVNAEMTEIQLSGGVVVPIARSQKKDMKRLLRIS